MLKTFVALEGRAPLLSEIPKPCDHFDLIGGTGCGGLIAILLGRLRLDLETCKNVYARVSKEVFESDKTIGGLPYKKTLFKASKLEECIRSVVREYVNRPPGSYGGDGDNETISNYFSQHTPSLYGRDSGIGSGHSVRGIPRGLGDGISLREKSTFESYRSGTSTSSGSQYGDAPPRKKSVASTTGGYIPNEADPGDAFLFDTRIDRCKT